MVAFARLRISCATASASASGCAAAVSAANVMVMLSFAASACPSSAPASSCNSHATCSSSCILVNRRKNNKNWILQHVRAISKFLMDYCRCRTFQTSTECPRPTRILVSRHAYLLPVRISFKIDHSSHNIKNAEAGTGDKGVAVPKPGDGHGQSRNHAKVICNL